MNVLVCAYTGSFEGFRRELLIFVGDHVNAKRKLIDVGTFAAKIENADFRIGDTTVETRFGVWLEGGKKLAL